MAQHNFNGTQVSTVEESLTNARYVTTIRGLGKNTEQVLVVAMYNWSKGV